MTGEEAYGAALAAIKKSGGGGSFHEYSFKEHIIGIWSDGKPLYEISALLYKDGVLNTDVCHVNGNEHYVTGVVGNVVDADLYLYRNYESSSANYISVGADDTCLFCGLVGKNTHEIGCFLQFRQGVKEAIVTFKYTKNSDVI